MNGENSSAEPAAMPLSQLPPQLWMADFTQSSSMSAVSSAKHVVHALPSQSVLASAKHVSSQVSPLLGARKTFLSSPLMSHA